MTDNLSPGFHVEEQPSQEQAIPAAPASVTAFVGRTCRGPLNQAVKINSYREYTETFGGFWKRSPLSYAVDQFFDNGGRDAIIVRIINAGRCASIVLPCGYEKLVLRAVHPGAHEAVRVAVDYDNIGDNEPERFNLVVQRLADFDSSVVRDQEIYTSVSIKAGLDDSLDEMLLTSQLLRAQDPLPSVRPDATQAMDSSGAVEYINARRDGDDGDDLSDYDLIGSATESTGLFALDQIQSNGGGINMLVLPPLSRDSDVGPVALLAAQRYCRAHRAMLLLDPPRRWAQPDDLLDGFAETGLGSENTVMFFPRIRLRDKMSGRLLDFGAAASMAGVIARIDRLSGVWNPPSGDAASLRGIVRPQCDLTQTQRNAMHRIGISTLQSIRPGTVAPSVALTLAGSQASQSDWRYLPARRLALFITDSIEKATRWVVFERNDAMLWERLRLRVSDFLDELFQSGAFPGRSSADAFFVVCDQTVNDDRAIIDGEVVIIIGIAVAEPASFRIYRISHSVRGSNVREVPADPMRVLSRTPMLED